MNIFFDLDGTLIDSRKRLYNLFQFLVPQSTLKMDEYWKFKREKNSHKMILENQFNYSDKEIMVFEKKWLELIELPEYLDMDSNFTSTQNVLNQLSSDNILYLVTARQFEQNLIVQLEKLGLLKYFTEILVTKHLISKEELIDRTCETTIHDIIIGDTGNDVLVGKALDIRTIAIENGFLSREILKEYNPDFIISDLNQIMNIIQ